MGGGIYVNMTKLPGLATERGDGEQLGKSLSGFIYEPLEGTGGGYLTAIGSVVKPTVLTLDLTVLVELGNNDAGNFSFKKLTVKGGGYILPAGLMDRAQAPIIAGVQMELDFGNKRISAAFNIHSKFYIPHLIKLTIDSTKSKGALMLDWKNDKYYFKMGKPLEQLGVSNWSCSTASFGGHVHANGAGH